MNKHIIESLVFLFIAIVVYLLGRMHQNESPIKVVSEIMANCKFNPPGMYRPGPYFMSIKWCVNVDREELIQVMNHIQVNVGDFDIAFGAEFGSNVRVGYIPSLNEFLINPVIIDKSETFIMCHTSSEGKSHPRHDKSETIHVQYYNKTFQGKERIFTKRESCLIQSMLENM